MQWNPSMLKECKFIVKVSQVKQNTIMIKDMQNHKDRIEAKILGCPESSCNWSRNASLKHLVSVIL